MARKRLSQDELFKAWAEMEQERKSKGEEIAPKENSLIEGTRMLREEKCKNCREAFYKYFPATENFPQPSEYCGCRKKHSLVDPNGRCESFA